MMAGLTKTMKKRAMSFPEAFRLLEQHEIIILVGRMYIFDLDYENVLDQQERN